MVLGLMGIGSISSVTVAQGGPILGDMKLHDLRQLASSSSLNESERQALDEIDLLLKKVCNRTITKQQMKQLMGEASSLDYNALMALQRFGWGVATEEDSSLYHFWRKVEIKNQPCLFANNDVKFNFLKRFGGLSPRNKKTFTGGVRGFFTDKLARNNGPHRRPHSQGDFNSQHQKSPQSQ